MTAKVKLLYYMIIVAGLSIFIILNLSSRHFVKANKSATIVTGLSNGQAEYFQEKLGVALEQNSYILAGRRLEKDGDLNGAINSYELSLALSKKSGEKSTAWYFLAGAYEKKHDYENALKWMMLAKDNCPAWSQKPDVERVTYMKYILQGDYDAAVMHAQKAIDEYDAMMNGRGLQRQEYIDRFTDLIAAKDYIVSLKKK